MTITKSLVAEGLAVIGDLDHSCGWQYANFKRLGAELYFAGLEEWRFQQLADYGKLVTIDEVIS